MARRRMGQGAEHLDGRRLSRTVRTEEGEDLPLGHREVDTVDGGQVAVALGQATDIDRRRSRIRLAKLQSAERDTHPS